jgi:hypothetical protein
MVREGTATAKVLVGAGVLVMAEVTAGAGATGPGAPGVRAGEVGDRRPPGRLVLTDPDPIGKSRLMNHPKRKWLTLKSRQPHCGGN